MNTNDEILDLLIKRDLLLQRVGNGLSKDVASQYIEIIDNAIKNIGKNNISLLNMNKIIKQINNDIYEYYPTIENDLKQIMETESIAIPTAINTIVAVDIVKKTLPPQAINKILKVSYTPDGFTIAEAFQNAQNGVISQIRLGIINGTTTQEILSNINLYKNALEKKGMDNIVKTSISTIVNNVRMQTYKENESIFKGYQHQGVLDGKTTFICAERDNLTWTLDLKPIGHKLPFKQTPIHYRCRSIILPLTKSYRELGLDIDEISVGTRSSLNGYVPANTSFSQWFDKQSQDFKENYLGKGRYQLYKERKITFSDLVSQKGRMLTISELKKLS